MSSRQLSIGRAFDDRPTRATVSTKHPRPNLKQTDTSRNTWRSMKQRLKRHVVVVLNAHASLA